MKVQFGGSSQCNNYKKESINVDYENKFAARKKARKLILNNNFILFIVVFVTYKNITFKKIYNINFKSQL